MPAFRYEPFQPPNRKGRGERVIHACVPCTCYAIAAAVAGCTVTLFVLVRETSFGPTIELPFDVVDNEGEFGALPGLT